MGPRTFEAFFAIYEKDATTGPPRTIARDKLAGAIEELPPALVLHLNRSDAGLLLKLIDNLARNMPNEDDGAAVAQAVVACEFVAASQDPSTEEPLSETVAAAWFHKASAYFHRLRRMDRETNLGATLTDELRDEYTRGTKRALDAASNCLEFAGKNPLMFNMQRIDSLRQEISARKGELGRQTQKM
jgi:hypothetical protein